MPEFFPDHVPAGCTAFEEGYFSAAEWLANGYGPKYENDSSLDDTDRAKLRGWTRDAIAKGKADCVRFCEENREDLAAFCEITGRDLDLAGYCFWLSRNGHGAGFFDRDAGDVGDRLQEVCEKWSEVDVESFHNRLVFVP